MFQHSPEELSRLCQHALDLAAAQGATAAEADISESVGQSVQVRLGNTDQIEYQQDRSLDLTVYVGSKKGTAASSDFSETAVKAAVKAALDIARYTGEDPCAGLADPALLAINPPEETLQSYFAWDIDTATALQLAHECEQAARSHDPRISNSDGAGVQTGHHQNVYGNSHGFLHHRFSSRHGISCAVVAGSGKEMQRDYWFDAARDPADLQSPEEIGIFAARRTVNRLNARRLPTGNYPVVFDTGISGSLIGHLVGALSGSALYRHTSFLCDSLGKPILPETFTLSEEPHIPKAFGSTYYDAEGVATHTRKVIENGIILGYFLSSYSGRKLGMQTTANAGGIHNLRLTHSHDSQAELLREMGSGLLVTELMGQGVNLLTGDYSRGAAGFWVENGVIAYPVEEITIASRLQEMLPNICGVADDALKRSANKIGSIWIERMTVAGN